MKLSEVVQEIAILNPLQIKAEEISYLYIRTYLSTSDTFLVDCDLHSAGNTTGTLQHYWEALDEEFSVLQRQVSQ